MISLPLSRGLSRPLSFRSGGFSPLSLLPTLWLDASDANTLYTGASLATADGAISQWRDKSGNARHATQVTGVSQPIRKPVIKNARDVVRFDGANDFFGISSIPTMTAGTVFMAFGGTTMRGGVFTTKGPDDWTRYDGDKGYIELLRSSRIETWYNIAPSGSHVLTVKSDATATDGWLDGTALASQAPAYATGALWRVGRSGGFWNGDIYEILVYPTALSAADRQAVELYLNAKWAIY